MSKSISFENVIFANNGASGRVDIGLIGMEVATGHADFNIMEMKTGVTVGTATLDIHCKGMDIIGFDGQVDFKVFDLDGTQIFHTMFNSDNGMEGADEFINRICKFTCKSEANVRELMYNACMAISDTSEVYKEHITFGSKHSA